MFTLFFRVAITLGFPTLNKFTQGRKSSMDTQMTQIIQSGISIRVSNPPTSNIYRTNPQMKSLYDVDSSPKVLKKLSVSPQIINDDFVPLLT